MRIFIGQFVKLIEKIPYTELYDTKTGMNRNVIGRVLKSELLLVLQTESSGIEAKVLTPQGVVGWVTGAWLTSEI